MTTTIRMIATLLALFVAGASHAQTASPNYPTRPVRVIVAYPPGGPTDLIARLVAQKMSEHFGQQFYVENLSRRGRRHRRRHRGQCAPRRAYALHHHQ